MRFTSRMRSLVASTRPSSGSKKPLARRKFCLAHAARETPIRPARASSAVNSSAARRRESTLVSTFRALRRASWRRTAGSHGGKRRRCEPARQSKYSSPNQTQGAAFPQGTGGVAELILEAKYTNYISCQLHTNYTSLVCSWVSLRSQESFLRKPPRSQSPLERCLWRASWFAWHANHHRQSRETSDPGMASEYRSFDHRGR